MEKIQNKATLIVICGLKRVKVKTIKTYQNIDILIKETIFTIKLYETLKNLNAFKKHINFQIDQYKGYQFTEEEKVKLRVIYHNFVKLCIENIY